MISLDEINNEIQKLENQPASYATIERLSWLYTVKDHIAPIEGVMPKGNTEYMIACSGKSVGCVMEVMDELMSTLYVIQPGLYKAVMERIS